MFNLGGIVSGIGIAADETVRAGRRNKHEKEQIGSDKRFSKFKINE